MTANNTPFYYDYQNGTYGYNTSSTRGADTFHPFRQSLPILWEYSGNYGENFNPTSTTQFCEFNRTLSNGDVVWVECTKPNVVPNNNNPTAPWRSGHVIPLVVGAEYSDQYQNTFSCEASCLMPHSTYYKIRMSASTTGVTKISGDTLITKVVDGTNFETIFNYIRTNTPYNYGYPATTHTIDLSAYSYVIIKTCFPQTGTAWTEPSSPGAYNSGGANMVIYNHFLFNVYDKQAYSIGNVLTSSNTRSLHQRVIRVTKDGIDFGVAQNSNSTWGTALCGLYGLKG